jgi:hypothetical protein
MRREIAGAADDRPTARRAPRLALAGVGG